MSQLGSFAYNASSRDDDDDDDDDDDEEVMSRGELKSSSKNFSYGAINNEKEYDTVLEEIILCSDTKY